VPQNKGMKLTRPERIGASQLIPGVGRALRENDLARPSEAVRPSSEMPGERVPIAKGPMAAGGDGRVLGMLAELGRTVDDHGLHGVSGSLHGRPVGFAGWSRRVGDIGETLPNDCVRRPKSFGFIESAEGARGSFFPGNNYGYSFCYYRLQL
jgi:hypothetical protein